MKQKGYVYLVGAGPGDIRLITLKGYECLQKADVVLYDRLVNPLFLEWAKPEAELIYCGKLPNRHILRQEKINELLVKNAQAGKVVVRLKGGDPSVFGRVGEEVQALQEAGVSFQVVPGITAAIGAATYAGVPVTHRDYGTSFAVVTGHDQSISGKPSIDWEGLAKGVDTIAFYMGVSNIAYISEKLLNHGRPKETPALLVQWGTVGQQRTLVGTLSTIAMEATKARITNPSILLVGDVVKLRSGESWFEQQRLFSKQILYGTTGETSQTVNLLREEGAEVFEFPRWKVEKCVIPYLEFSKYEQIVFSSSKSVDYFFQYLRDNKIDIRSITAQFYGTNTKVMAAIEQFSCFATHINQLYSKTNLLVFGEQPSLRDHIELDKKWGEHTFASTHQRIPLVQSLSTCQRMLEEGRVNTVVFPTVESVDEVTNYIAHCHIVPRKLSEVAKIICYNEKVAQYANELGYFGIEVLTAPTAEALIKHLSNKVLVER